MAVDTTSEALKAARAGWTRGFAAAYRDTTVWYPMISTSVSSSGPQNTYTWAMASTGMRKWLGERVAQTLASASYALVNEEWELTVEINRNDFDDDNLGVHDMWIAQNAQQSRRHKDTLAASLLKNGHATLCFDGQNFYDTDHPVAQNDSTYGTYINHFGSTALASAGFRTVRQAMLERKGEANQPLRVNPNLCQVPPALEGPAEDLFLAQYLAAGGSNQDRGKADILVTPELAGDATEDGTWYLHDTTTVIKPLVDQNRRALAINAIADPSSERVFMNGVYTLAIDARYNMGYTLPFLSSKAQAAAL